MHHIVYTSTLNFPFAEPDLQLVLDRWRAKNERLAVTGVLLHSEGYVMQVLEGPAETVQPLFKSISADVRHRAITRLADGPVDSRAFADWSMRFRTVDTADFARLLQQIKASSAHASSLAQLLEVFMASEPW
jgi:hypothetical protein